MDDIEVASDPIMVVWASCAFAASDFRSPMKTRATPATALSNRNPKKVLTAVAHMSKTEVALNNCHKPAAVATAVPEAMKRNWLPPMARPSRTRQTETIVCCMARWGRHWPIKRATVGSWVNILGRNLPMANTKAEKDTPCTKANLIMYFINDLILCMLSPSPMLLLRSSCPLTPPLSNHIVTNQNNDKQT